MRLSAIALFASGLVLAAPLAAQQRVAPDSIRDDAGFAFYDRGPYRPNVPRPESILGYAIGAQNTQYAMQEKVLFAIANAAKDRVKMEEYGSTSEGRTMRVYIVSAPENIARLDAIHADLDRIADPRGATQAELDAIVARTPPTVWFSHSVHGNESPGFESAMQLLYQLAASEEPATMEMLKKTLVIINPSSNPDGHERFTVWYNSVAVGNPDPSAMEHDEPWSIQGRFNHYRFDMNRDVMGSTQREVRAMMGEMIRWHPMVSADLHGQVGTYFFPPDAREWNANLGSDWSKWMEYLGKGNAAAFDAHGWMYYARDEFDFYYPAYWDVFPSLMGGAGMTFETDGGGWKGTLYRRDDGSLVSFRDGIAKHYTASMATIATTAAHAAERVKDYLAFRQTAVNEGRTGAMKRIVFEGGKDPERAAELAATLLRGGIEVRRANAGFASVKAHAYADDAVAAKQFASGAYIVDLAQPQGKLAKAWLEPQPAQDSVFVREQVAKYRRNVRRGQSGSREGYEFYDISAWSLPVAFGVDTWWTEDAAPVTGSLLALPADDPSKPAAERPRRVLGDVTPVDVPGGVVGGAKAQSAYVFSPDRDGAPSLAWHLMAEGYRVMVATTPIEVDRVTWPRGTYVVRVARNDAALPARIDALARDAGVEVTAASSAFNETAQHGLGSESMVALTLPKIAIVGDEGISQTSYGALWWEFEHRYGITFEPISLGYLSGSDLTKFNVIILPDAYGGAIGARMGKDGVERLKTWLQNGGTLITMEGSTAWAAREDVNLTSARRVGADGGKDGADASDTTAGADTSKAKKAKPALPERGTDELIPVASPSSGNASPQPLPGTHFDVELDRTHWLTYGIDRARLTVLMDGGAFYKLSKEGANVAVFPTSGLLTRSGFTFPDNTERLLRGTAFLIEEAPGDGHVILFANEPMFRGWWRALDQLMMNGVVLGPAF